MPTVSVCQITDLHLTADPAARMKGRDPHATLSRVLDAVAADAPDLVLATGDLVDDGAPASYRRLRSLLDRLPAPVHALPGNHDLMGPMREHLAGGNIGLGPVVDAGAWRLVLVDSTVEGEPHGHLGEDRLVALGRHLDGGEEPHVLVALHHPPAPIDSPLDDVGLLNADALHAVLDARPRVKALLWGHTHHVHESRRQGVRRFGSPSTCVQFDHRPEMGFRTTGEPPAYRRLALHDDGTIETEVVWVPLPD